MQSILGYNIKNSTVGVLAGVIFASLLLFTGGQPVHAAADTCTWTGLGADTSITTAGNWTGCDNGTVPENGDDLVFPAGPTNKVVYLDVARFFNNITISGSGYTESSVNGSTGLYAQGDITISGDNNTFNSSVWLFPTTSATFTSTGNGNVLANDLVIQAFAANTDVVFDIQTDILVEVLAQAGSYDLRSVTKTGSGTFEQGNAAITGVTVTDNIDITDGIWKCDSQFCIGDENNIVNVGTDGTVEFAQPAWIGVGSITGNGTIAFTNADAHVFLGNGSISGTFSGSVEGRTDSTLEIVDGVWTFTGTNTDVGDGYTSYYINGGTLLANASDASLGSSPFSISDGVLGGSGTIGPLSVYSGGTLSPGNSPGCLNVTGDTAFQDSDSFFTTEIQGTTVCTDYDQLTATGTIYLNDATLALDVDSGLTLTNGQVFIIMTANAIEGTFNGLADGDTITSDDGLNFVVNYTATTVTLTYVADSAPATNNNSTPTASTSDLASTGQNSVTILTITSLVTAAAALILISRYSLLRR